MLSHICIPKSTLLRFSNSGILHYLDTQCNRVRKSPASSFLTGENYYTPETESFLSKTLEAKMGRLYESVHRFRERKQDTFDIDLSFNETVRDALAIQIIRSPEFLRKTVLPLIPYDQRHGVKYMANYILNDNRFAEYRDTCVDFREYNAIILINKTSADFFLPSIHFYIVKHGGENSYLLILSPKDAVAMIHRKVFNKFYRDEHGVLYPSVNEASEVDVMNKDCIRFDAKYGAGKIVGGKSELNRIAAELNPLKPAKLTT